MSNSESNEDYKGALFPLSYNYRLCICRNKIQWIVQRRVNDSSRWASISYHRTKEGLFFRLFSKSRPVDVSPAALALLSGLPDRIE